MHWAYPHNFWCVLLAAAAGTCFALTMLRQRRGCLAFSARDGSQPLPLSGPRQSFKLGLRCVALLLLALAALGPCWGECELPPTPARGRDLLVLLDVSRSMNAEDALPSRLSRARADLKALAKELEARGGYRIGLIAFADRAALLCPLTTDFRHFYEELEEASVESLRLRHDGLLARDGTELAAALARAERALPKPQQENEPAESHADIILVSDGGDDLDDQTKSLAETLAGRNVRVFTVGVGDPAKASPIPIVGPGNRRQLLTFQGEVVHTRLEEAALRELARLTSAAYVGAATQPMPVAELIPLLESRPLREITPKGQAREPIHRYAWFLLPAVVLLLIDPVISIRRRRTQPSGPALPSKPPWLVRLVPPPRKPTGSTSAPGRRPMRKRLEVTP